MAGIGFRIQKLISGESYSDLIRAYLYSAMISAGPMLIVIVLLAVLNYFIQLRLTEDEGRVFMGLVLYVYAFSMLGVAPFLYVVTRYIADKFYLKEIEAFTPVYLSVCELVFALQATVAIVFLWPLPMMMHIKLTAFSLYLFVNGIWLAMIFLSAASRYLWLVGAFLAGAIGGVSLGLYWGMGHGLAGFLNGFTLGQGVIFFTLTWRIFAEFGYKRTHDYGFLFYFKRHPYLVGVGIFYFVGIWIDKMVFWFSSHGESVIGTIRFFSMYDTPMFIAYLTIVPSMAFFLIRMETNFSTKYNEYFKHVRTRSPLRDILTRKFEMITTLTNSFEKFVFFQGVISSLVIIFIYEIATAFFLDPMQMGIFRIGILGAFLQMGFIMVINILFYFDCQFEVCVCCFLFMMLNLVGTLLTLTLGLPAYGFGYTVAGFISLLASYLVLHNRLRHLEYWTFMRQPILIPRFKLESEKAKVSY